MTKQHAFRYLWIGQSLSNCGDVFYIVGLMTVMYAVTRSAMFMTLIPFLMTFIRFISGILAPLILDRLGLKEALVCSQIGKSFFLLLMALALTFHGFGPDFLIVFFFVVCIGFLDGWASPARNAMVPLLIDRERLVKANGFLSLLDQSINLSGWAFGGILAAFIGGGQLVWVTFFLFVLSTVCMCMIRIDTAFHTFNRTDSSVGKLKIMVEGWHAIWRSPALRVISISETIGNVSSVVWMAAIVLVFVHQALHVNASWWGFINFSFFAGLIIGGSICVRFSASIHTHLKVAALTGLFMTGAATLFFGWNTYPLLALMISAAVGLFEQLKNVAFETLIQTNTKSNLLAKVYSAQDALYALSYGLATVLFGCLIDKIGVQFVFTLSGVLLFISFMYAAGFRRYLTEPAHVGAHE
ncbi:MFS transporter [Sporolactobacillus sp. CPB3-1]|uniref:MFS transporter n=1 Tax=Sporolactobacillus mangiferae TaxID=2940498 RepID=A0ABT0M8Z3_9BACL|nr:MFS transporter [Sporolactobacillus mangiferae]MCL1631344.1 MFS transporter [Sporolactobacillus mangiferae]